MSCLSGRYHRTNMLLEIQRTLKTFLTTQIAFNHTDRRVPGGNTLSSLSAQWSGRFSHKNLPDNTLGK